MVAAIESGAIVAVDGAECDGNVANEMGSS